MTKSSEISPFLSSRLKVDSQLSNCSGGPDKEKTTFHYLDDFKEDSSKSDQKIAIYSLKILLTPQKVNTGLSEV